MKINFKYISRIHDVYKIVMYLKELGMEYEEFMNEKFQRELINANPLAKEAIEIYLNEDAVRRIEHEIEKNGIESVLDEDFKIDLIPGKYRSQLFEVAQRFEKDGEYDKAMKLYERIINLGATQANKFNRRYGHEIDDRNTIFYKSKFSYYMCERKLGIEPTDDEKQDLDSLVKEDKDNILNLSQPGELRDIDVLSGMFSEEEKTAQEFLEELKSNNETDENGKKRRNEKTKDRPPELSSSNIFDRIVEMFGRENIILREGKGNFKGYSWIGIKGREFVILEKFSDYNRQGEQTNVKNARTYVIHQDADLDILSAATVGKIIEARKKQDPNLKLIETVNHTFGERFFDRLKKRIESVEKNAEILRAANNTEPQAKKIGERIGDKGEISVQQKKAKLEEMDAQNIPNEMEENEPDEKAEDSEKEVFIEEKTDSPSTIEEKTDSTSIIDEKTDTLLKLTSDMGALDTELSDIQSQIKYHLQQKEETNKIIDDISEMLKCSAEKPLDSDEMVTKITKGVERIKLQKNELKTIDETIRRLEERESENREKRAELTEQFKQALQNMVHGED